MGNSYAALAADAYAPVFNPAGLGFLRDTQISGMHLSYLDSMSYEFGSAAYPLSIGQSVGAAIQYFQPGSTPGADSQGNPTGDFSGSNAAYSLAYGKTIGSRLALGVTGKYVHASIADFSASAYGFDVGSMVQLSPHCTLAFVVANLGTSLKFLNQPDPLPLSYNLGAMWSPFAAFHWAVQEEYGRSGASVFRTGAEWLFARRFFLRAGYKTDTLRELSPLAGLTTGVGVQASIFEFDYAWLPMGDLGDTQYFSVVAKWGEAHRNLIVYHRHEPEPVVLGRFYPYDTEDDATFLQEMEAYEEVHEAHVEASQDAQP